MSQNPTMPVPANLDSSRLVPTARRFVSALLLMLAVAACGNKEAPYVERPVEELYNQAMDAMAASEWEAAAKGFD